MTQRKFNPAWPSAQADTKEARRLRKAAQRKREQEQMQQLDNRLAPIGLNHESLVSGLIDGTVGVYVIAPTHIEKQ